MEDSLQQETSDSREAAELSDAAKDEGFQPGRQQWVSPIKIGLPLISERAEQLMTP